ncbi:MAG: ABC transporter permease subunit [Halobacteriovoraceae bacterium]|nr:ABC transporter permease subunit [Halobacteriovoraceae bacterium]
MIKFNPLTLKKIKRFKSIKRSYFSLLILSLLVFLSLFAELFINNKALIVHYKGNIYFPIVSSYRSGKDFGENYSYEANYRKLKEKFAKENSGNYVIMPLIPYNPFENDLPDGVYPPTSPDISSFHFLGTDSVGRDILARLVFGFRIAIMFSLLLLFFNYLIGISVGCIMGYFGGLFDLLFQRIIEIWSNIPFLYVVIILSSIIVPNFYSLCFIMVFFGWIHMTWYMRTATYKEKTRDYVMAAKSLGASESRIIFHHILPNSISIIVTFIPFSVASGIAALTSLDFLGFGLPVPTPSWGELLKQGIDNLDSFWILGPVVFSLTSVLIMITFIGEGIREAYDPKKHLTYE